MQRVALNAWDRQFIAVAYEHIGRSLRSCADCAQFAADLCHVGDGTGLPKLATGSDPVCLDYKERERWTR